MYVDLIEIVLIQEKWCVSLSIQINTFCRPSKRRSIYLGRQKRSSLTSVLPKLAEPPHAPIYKSGQKKTIKTHQ